MTNLALKCVYVVSARFYSLCSASEIDCFTLNTFLNFLTVRTVLKTNLRFDLRFEPKVKLHVHCRLRFVLVLLLIRM